MVSNSAALALLLVGISTAGRSQSAPELLPPPPPSLPGASANPGIDPTAPIPTAPLSPLPQTPLAPTPQETVFQAPIDFQRAVPGKYLVYVNGDSSYLLQQVQTVEPRAFIQTYQGRRVIQVGTFNEETNAQRQVTALAAQGIRAETRAANSAANPMPINRYLIVVPGSRNELPQLADQAIRLGVRQDAIQPKEAPLGPHLEIGPFPGRGEAETVSRYLRRSGMDSRVYYSR
ncbi:hypothetical protein H6F43_05560 [Leptolyngbya sp. FACHB-36]|nr:hypothetical protein [Leptolyngbya sp. FACHB-36]